MTSTVRPSTDSPGQFIHRTIAVIRHTYAVSGYPPVPWIHTRSVFDPQQVEIEVGTNPANTILKVRITGGLIVDTDDGPMVTSHPSAAQYVDAPDAVALGLGDMPAWVTALIRDAVQRTREAWA